MNQLKQIGFVVSRRGNKGGYLLNRSPGELTIGEVIKFIQGSIGPVECMLDSSDDKCSLYGRCVFLPVWEKAREAMLNVYDSITFQQLVDSENAKEHAIHYSI